MMGGRMDSKRVSSCVRESCEARAPNHRTAAPPRTGPGRRVRGARRELRATNGHSCASTSPPFTASASRSPPLSSPSSTPSSSTPSSPLTLSPASPRRARSSSAIAKGARTGCATRARAIHKRLRSVWAAAGSLNKGERNCATDASAIRRSIPGEPRMATAASSTAAAAIAPAKAAPCTPLDVLEFLPLSCTLGVSLAYRASCSGLTSASRAPMALLIARRTHACSCNKSGRAYFQRGAHGAVRIR
mmetsp:Transcript_8440/g.26167  ORF Transcript_8440/g.26167 Transcript_8440/m.26167 type:complete len:246 (+) Transcript_8440:547-1284(+)